MTISRAVDYSILVLSYLSSLPKNNAIKSKSKMAEKLKLPSEFLSKILQKLTKANIIQSVYGPQGGYSLIKMPEEISLRTIIEIIDGPSHMVKCLYDNDVECNKLKLCQSNIEKMRSVQQQINLILEGVTFDELMVTQNT